MKNLFLITLTFLTAGLSEIYAQEYANAAAPKNKTAGYMGMAEIGFLYGKTGTQHVISSNAYPTVQLFNGYRFHRSFGMGLTLAADFYDNMLITPVALGIRGDVLNRRISPYYSLDAGYGSAKFSNESEHLKNTGGWMYNPSLGLRVNTGNLSAFTFGIGYKSQIVSRKATGWHSMVEQRIHYKRLALRMGFMF